MKKETRCKQTMTGRHLFTSIFGEVFDKHELAKLKLWNMHGVNNPSKCIACGVIDDRNKQTLHEKTN